MRAFEHEASEGADIHSRRDSGTAVFHLLMDLGSRKIRRRQFERPSLQKGRVFLSVCVPFCFTGYRFSGRYPESNS